MISLTTEWSFSATFFDEDSNLCLVKESRVRTIQLITRHSFVIRTEKVIIN